METPLMKQYYEIKKKYRDMILFYRVGDFYETFGDDARIVSKELDLVLTSRNREKDNIPMAGIPYHALYSYIGKLVNKGYKVALCEQLEDPKLAKGIVKRDVIRIFTPGTIFEEELLNTVTNYLCSISNDNDAGIVFADVSTGEFRGSWFKPDDSDSLFSELYKINPREIVISNSMKDNVKNYIKEKGISYNIVQMNRFEAEALIKDHFNIQDLKSIGIHDKDALIIALGSIIDYLEKTDRDVLKVLKNFRLLENSDYLILDETTLKNLEVFRDVRNEEKNSLLGIMDQCTTKMGSRLLRHYLNYPFIDPVLINDRLDAVQETIHDTIGRMVTREYIKNFPDLERIWSRILIGKASPNDLISLKNAIKKIPAIKNFFENKKSRYLIELKNRIIDLDDIINKIENAIDEKSNEGYRIKDGFDKILDDYRKTILDAEKNISSIEEKEIKNTGIKNLRIGYNDVFGYYIEMPKSQISKIPSYFIRKQTLKNVERFTTQELETLQYSVQEAKENIQAREQEVYNTLLDDLSKTPGVRELGTAIGDLDIILTFADISVKRKYTRPVIDESTVIDIKEGRHPVVENFVDSFVPNDTYMDTEKNRFLIITGPNMAGKSTYMRQIALITILAQIGSFVPASQARIGVVDRIFTRIGATDDILRGQSTFMTEMTELANILTGASIRSLIILDEIGRGTSTFDGLSIAWATVEYIQNKIMARTVFATHYHQLIDLENYLDGVKNYHIPVLQNERGIIFTRKLKRGGISESYGIEVASMAGLPKTVIERAKEILKKIETENVLEVKKATKEKQLSLYDIILRDYIKSIDENISPEDALKIIKDLKKMIQG